MAKRLKKVPTRIKETPRSAATSLYVFPRKKSFPIGDLFHARLALIYALSPTHAKVADKVFRAVQKAYPQYDWERWWDEHSDEEEYRRVANPIKMTSAERSTLNTINSFLKRKGFIKLNIHLQLRESGTIIIPFKETEAVKGYIFFKEVIVPDVEPFIQIGYEIKFYNVTLDDITAIKRRPELLKFLTLMQDRYEDAMYGYHIDDYLDDLEYDDHGIAKDFTRKSNPVATGTLMALGLGFILGSKK